MAVTLQRAWNIATELSDKADILNKKLGSLFEAKEAGEEFTPAQRTAIRNRATTMAQEMQILLSELLAP